MPMPAIACATSICFILASAAASKSLPWRPNTTPMARRFIRAPATNLTAASRLSGCSLDTQTAIARAGILTFSVVGPLITDRPQIRYARPERWGDVMLQRKGAPTSYHLSVVVDDTAQAITHVSRGHDMDTATDLHVLLQMLLAFHPDLSLPPADPG